ncbi:MAG: flippase [Bacilli bacterium]
MKSLKKNYFYNVIYQLLIIALPLFTAPYLSRTIGAELTGVYSYSFSIATYFLMFCTLGLNNFGNRAIAKVRDNKQEMSATFKNIYFIQLILSLIVSLVYILFILFFVDNNKVIFTIMLLYVVSGMFDINWFFFGLEEFKLTVSRNIIIKVVATILIFTLVKDPSDFWLYVTIMSGSFLLSQMTLFPFLKKYIDFNVKTKLSDSLKMFVPILILFIPVIATGIYRNMDKIMLGILSDMYIVGQYEYADKFVSIPVSLIASLGIIFLPRISNLVANGNAEKGIDYLKKSYEFIIFLSVPLAFGIFSVADNFIPIFLGNDFNVSGYLLQILSLTIIFIAIGNTFKTQYLIPNNLDKNFVLSVLIGAIVNCILNFLWIPKYNAYGAATATLIAEIIVMFFQVFPLRKRINLKFFLKITKKYIFCGLVMTILINLLRLFINSNILLISLQILIGGVVYLLLTYNYWKNILKSFCKNKKFVKISL